MIPEGMLLSAVSEPQLFSMKIFVIQKMME